MTSVIFVVRSFTKVERLCYFLLICYLIVSQLVLCSTAFSQQVFHSCFHVTSSRLSVKAQDRSRPLHPPTMLELTSTSFLVSRRITIICVIFMEWATILISNRSTKYYWIKLRICFYLFKPSTRIRWQTFALVLLTSTFVIENAYRIFGQAPEVFLLSVFCQNIVFTKFLFFFFVI